MKTLVFWKSDQRILRDFGSETRQCVRFSKFPLYKNLPLYTSMCNYLLSGRNFNIFSRTFSIFLKQMPW